MTDAPTDLGLSDDDLWQFNEGTHARLYDHLGAHPVDGGTRFAVWAPNAEAVSVVGDFNDWRVDDAPLEALGSSGIWADHVLAADPHVSFHVNGGPVAIPDEDFPRLVDQSEIALQICTAGNLRTTLLVAELLAEKSRLDRLLTATDTPTGSGIMPLGMLYTITHLCALGGMEPEIAIATATGNNASVYRLNSGIVAPGKDADVILLDACSGGSKNDALSAITNGDIPAVCAVVTAGEPRFVGRSRNTPASIKKVRVAECRVMNDFSGTAH